MNASVTQSTNLGNQYQILYSLFQGESLPIAYRVAADSGNADVPSAAVLTVSQSKGGTVLYTAACTIANNTTSYDVSVTIPAATMADREHGYYFSVEETHATFQVKVVSGVLTVYPSVEVES